ncbi:MAG TPA: tRNA (N(6)-L-threonylcarbamoyladenosine(37)-C(2))-methylthiotransferase MtaB [Candidatus Methanoperedens sp.]|nr:tRNA (N(6)-L-threonylcarbamoyladenosine(37)-C(2))-methylthiotransferase MtaB [Candidatus Methanoperedens sp.]
MRTVAFHTIGCKLNQYETNDLERQFAERGWRVVAFGDPSDVTVVNTCTVTGRSDRRCRAALRKARRASPGGTVIAAGCYAEAQPAAVGDLAEVDLVLGNRGKAVVFEHLDEGGRPRAGRIAAGPREGGAPAPFVPIRAFAGHTRAFVKIQDGCDARCAYCIVPQARGGNRSLPAADVLAQVAALVAAGYPEVVLTGVHLGTWGRDLLPRDTLAALLARIVALSGLGRLRLSSIEPAEFTPELLEQLASSHAICPHLHIPLQSGAASVLRAMGRPYGPAQFAALVGRLAATLPDPGIGADVIAGFPGESERDFEETAALIESLPLTYLHVFPYSPRPGTPAASMAAQVPPPERERRAALLRGIGLAKAEAFRGGQVGRTVRALIEGRPGRAHALTGNYLKIAVRAAAADIGTFRDVRVLRHEGGLLRGELGD